MPSPRTDRKTLVIDLDGTICSQESSDRYAQARPQAEVIRRVNQLWTEGWDVVIYTARGMSTYGDASVANSAHREMTERWLEENRVCYTRLVFGKPAGDVYVDDKGRSIDDFTAGKV